MKPTNNYYGASVKDTITRLPDSLKEKIKNGRWKKPTARDLHVGALIRKEFEEAGIHQIESVSRSGDWVYAVCIDQGYGGASGAVDAVDLDRIHSILVEEDPFDRWVKRVRSSKS